MITHQIDDAPRVLVIGEKSWLKNELVSFWERNDLVVTTLSFQTFLERKNLAQEVWYKIVVLAGWKTTHITPVSELHKTLELLQNQTAPVYVVGRITTMFEVYEANEELTQYNKLNQDLETYLSQLQAWPVIIGKDVIPPQEEPQQRVCLPLTGLVLQLEQGILLEPQTEFSLQSSTQFLQMCKTLLLRQPTAGVAVYVGKKQTTASICEEIQRQYSLYFQQQLVITSYRGWQENISWPTEITQTVEPLPSLLQETVQALPSPQSFDTLAVIPQGNDSTTPPVQKQPVQRRQLPFQPKPVVVEPRVAVPVTIPQVNPPKIEYKNKVDKPSQPDQKPSPEAKIEAPEEKENSEGSLDKKLQTLFADYRTDTKVDRVTSAAQTTKKVTVKNKKRQILFLGGMAIGGVAVGLVVIAAVFGWSQQRLSSTLNEFAEHYVTGTTTKPTDDLVSAQQALKWQIAAYTKILPETFFSNAESLVGTSTDLTQSLEVIASVQAEQGKLFRQFLGLDSATLVASSFALQAEKAYQEVSVVTERLSEIAKTVSPQAQQDINAFIKDLDKVRRGLITYQQLQPLLPHLAAVEGKRTYAVVFQNEQELRPTGGFIAAVGIVTVDRGLVVDHQVFSSYQLDALLQGKVDPPEDLKRFLGEQQYFLRDSNWNPDFAASGELMTWFLERQLNKSIDGVLLMNIASLQELLKATGPLDVPAYNELLTDKNIWERMEFHSEVKLVETDKAADYPVTVFDTFLKQITKLPADKSVQFLTLLNQQFDSKGMAVYLKDSGEQSSIANLGWSGELLNPQCPPQFSAESCTVDSLAVIDTNVGINKANYHTQRTDTHDITLSPTQAQHVHTVSFVNSAQSNAWPKGTYKSYLRLYIPPQATVSRVLLNDTSLTASQVVTEQTTKWRILGIISETPIQSQTKITVEYVTPLPAAKEFAYTFFVNKQLGISQPLSEITMEHQAGMTPQIIAPQAQVTGQTIKFTGLSNDHFFAGVQFK
jgi:hypothetical protein